MARSQAPRSTSRCALCTWLQAVRRANVSSIALERRCNVAALDCGRNISAPFICRNISTEHTFRAPARTSGHVPAYNPPFLQVMDLLVTGRWLGSFFLGLWLNGDGPDKKQERLRHAMQLLADGVMQPLSGGFSFIAFLFFCPFLSISISRAYGMQPLSGDSSCLMFVFLRLSPP